MLLIDWILLVTVVIEAICIPIAFLNGFKSGMQVQYEKTKGLPPMVPAATFTKPTISPNGNGTQPDPLISDLDEAYYKS